MSALQQPSSDELDDSTPANQQPRAANTAPFASLILSGTGEDNDSAPDTYETYAMAVVLSEEINKSREQSSGSGSSRFNQESRILVINVTQKNGQEVTALSSNSAEAIDRLVALGNASYHLSHAVRNAGAVEVSIACRHKAALLTAATDPQMPERLFDLGISLLDRAKATESVSDLNQAITYIQGRNLDQITEAALIDMLDKLADALALRFRILGQFSDIESAIESEEHAINLAADDHECTALLKGSQAVFYWLRFGSSDMLGDIERAIEYLSFSIRTLPEGHENMPAMLNNLGSFYRSRWKRLGKFEDLELAISQHMLSLSLVPEGSHEEFHNLGCAHLGRYECLGELVDIESSIQYQSQALMLVPEGHKSKSKYLCALGSMHRFRFQRLVHKADIDRAIEYHSQSVSSIDQGHTELPGRLTNLGNSYFYRFDYLGVLEDIEAAIRCHHRAVLLTPEEHAEMPHILNNLGMSHDWRYKRLGQLVDLQSAFEAHSQAVLKTPEGHAELPKRLANLGNSYQHLFERTGKMTMLDGAIKSHSQAVELTAERNPDRPGRLCNLGVSHRTRFEHRGEQNDLESSIACHYQALLLTPIEHFERAARLVNLGSSHLRRFQYLGEIDDVDKAIECHFQAMMLTPEGNPDKANNIANLASSYQLRFARLGALEDIDRAIEFQSQAILRASEDHACKPIWLASLGNSHSARFSCLGKIEDNAKAIEYHSQAASLVPDGDTNKPTILSMLGGSYQARFKCLGDLPALDKAIFYQSEALALKSDHHTDKPSILLSLGKLHEFRFRHTGNREEIDTSIEYLNHSLALIPEWHAYRADTLWGLGSSYLTRFGGQGIHIDLVKALECLEAASQCSSGDPDTRLRASMAWARLLVQLNQSSPLPAYKVAMELIQKVIWIGTTVGHRYKNIPLVETVATEAAAIAVSAGEFALALEWLEEGRSIVWNQTLQLRSPFDDLAKVHPELAKGLAQVGQKLECAGRRIPGTEGIETNIMAPEQAAQDHHRLAEEYQQKVDHIRSLTGFEDFMLPKKATELLQVTHSGPVVVLNAHEAGCDALVLRPQDNEIGHLDLPDLSSGVAAKIHEQMQLSLQSEGVKERRPFWPELPPEDHFQNIMVALWHKLVRPVLDFLGYTQKKPVEQLPHITWCTTGVLSFIPIHAAGCYDETGDNIFNFAISSYTPTLRALLPSASRLPVKSGGILAISQESTPGLRVLRGAKKELAFIRQHAKDMPYKQLEGDKATAANVLDALENYDSVHFACHASQNYKPEESCFHMHDGPLSLKAIAQKALKYKGLAFLSACQTAAGNMVMPNEAVHLAAGMLNAGYPSVIATMWSIVDADAPTVANEVYGRLVDDGKLDCSQVARALHEAVGVLRGEVTEKEFSRWVPYIHIGV